MRNRLAGVRDPGRVRSVLEGTSTSIRTTEKILFSSDWRRIGAIGYLWFDIGVLIACFAAIGPVPPLACISDRLHSEHGADPRQRWRARRQLRRHARPLRDQRHGRNSATLVYHAIALWIPSLLGTAAFLVLRRSRGASRPPRPAREVDQPFGHERVTSPLPSEAPDTSAR
jgi:hypothetical protein